MSRPGNYNHRLEQRQKMEAVINGLVRNCSICQVASSKRRLFTLPEGDICANCAAEHVPVTDKNLYDLEAEHKAHLEAEKNKPAPQGYGGWA